MVQDAFRRQLRHRGSGAHERSPQRAPHPSDGTWPPGGRALKVGVLVARRVGRDVGAAPGPERPSRATTTSMSRLMTGRSSARMWTVFYDLGKASTIHAIRGCAFGLMSNAMIEHVSNPRVPAKTHAHRRRTAARSSTPSRPARSHRAGHRRERLTWPPARHGCVPATVMCPSSDRSVPAHQAKSETTQPPAARQAG